MADNTKSGRRHNSKDQAAVNKWHKAADELKSDMADLGAELEEAAPQTEAPAAKGADLPGTELAPVIFGAVKAAGDWELDVLYLPYGGPQNGRDSQGEYFSQTTNEHAEQFPNPLILYYHGHDEKGQPQGQPEIIGKAVRRWADNAGRWVRVQLDRASTYAKRIWDSAQAGKARASSGSIAHLARVDKSGHILNWPVVEVSLIDADGKRQPANQYAVALPATKANYAKAGQTFPDIPDDNADPQATGPHPAATESANVKPTQAIKGVFDMTPEELQALLDKRDADKAAREAVEAARKADEQTRIDAAVKAALDTERTKSAKSRRLPMGDDAPAQTRFADTRKFDGLKSGDLALAMTLLTAAKQGNIQGAHGFSDSATKALAIKIAEDKDSPAADEARQGMKAVGIEPSDFLSATKANEIDYSTQAGFGDEWAGVLYSRNLWEVVRAPTSIVGQLPTIEVPQGAESVVIPLEAADPTFYKVAQTTDHDATSLIPNATVTASKLATASNTLTVAKGGARTGWSGEMDEDSVVPFASQLRAQLEKAAAEQTEHLVIDGDTQTSSANINSTAGSLTTNLFLLFDAFRKSPIVTTTANSRSGGGSLADTDFLATAQLMGTAGLLGSDRQKTAFIIDANTQWKASQLLSVKTKDVYSNATLENGMLLGIWGYKVYTSYFMHFASAKRMAQTTGKIHATDSSNTTGSILAVRFDQWLLGYKRRITMEVTRYPRSDSSEITALFRIGLKQRDTEASAITYNVGV